MVSAHFKTGIWGWGFVTGATGHLVREYKMSIE